jgi:hypothetical protein
MCNPYLFGQKYLAISFSLEYVRAWHGVYRYMYLIASCVNIIHVHVHVEALVTWKLLAYMYRHRQ